mmetsp:Transcript_64588/g.154326  ORF Transcript_64588/g.154326 Transcript_64588/m.154326 type:complete len:426 (+) Transcript_64588:144-1421(+)
MFAPELAHKPKRTVKRSASLGPRPCGDKQETTATASGKGRSNAKGSYRRSSSVDSALQQSAKSQRELKRSNTVEGSLSATRKNLSLGSAATAATGSDTGGSGCQIPRASSMHSARSLESVGSEGRHSVVPELQDIGRRRASVSRRNQQQQCPQADGPPPCHKLPSIPVAKHPGFPLSSEGKVIIGLSWQSKEETCAPVFLSGDLAEVLRQNVWLRRETLQGLITYLGAMASKMNAICTEEHHLFFAGERHLSKVIFAAGALLGGIALLEYLLCMGIVKVGIAAAFSVIVMLVGLVLAICFQHRIPRNWLLEAEKMGKRYAADWTACHNSVESERNGDSDGTPDLLLVYRAELASRSLTGEVDLESGMQNGTTSTTKLSTQKTAAGSGHVACFFELSMVPVLFPTEISVDEWTRIPSPTIQTFPGK